jgi:hypothetical protein
MKRVLILQHQNQCLPCQDTHFSFTKLPWVRVLPRDAFQFCYTVIIVCLEYRSISVLLNCDRCVHCQETHFSSDELSSIVPCLQMLSSSTELPSMNSLPTDAFQFYWTAINEFLAYRCFSVLLNCINELLAYRCFSVLLNCHQWIPCLQMLFSSTELPSMNPLPTDAFQFYWTATNEFLAYRCFPVLLNCHHAYFAYR